MLVPVPAIVTVPVPAENPEAPLEFDQLPFTVIAFEPAESPPDAPIARVPAVVRLPESVVSVPLMVRLSKLPEGVRVMPFPVRTTVDVAQVKAVAG